MLFRSLGALVDDLCDTLARQLDHIDIRCSTEPVHVPPDHAASFALLVTELLTNAAKHAYGPEGGVVHVRLTGKNGRNLLLVSDEGVGLGPGFSIAAASEDSLGMNLIHALSQTVGGEIEVGQGRGAEFRITF